MSRIKNMSRAGWVISGVVITLILVPSVAVAAGLTYNGIEGTSGNKANVSTAGQLLTTENLPTKSFVYSFETTPSEGNASNDYFTSTNGTPPPAKTFFVITEVQVDAFNVPSTGPGDFADIFVEAPYGLPEIAQINPSGTGNAVIPFSNGIPVPSTANADGQMSVTLQGISVNVIATGYFAPCSDDEAMC